MVLQLLYDAACAGMHPEVGPYYVMTSFRARCCADLLVLVEKDFSFYCTGLKFSLLFLSSMKSRITVHTFYALLLLLLLFSQIRI